MAGDALPRIAVDALGGDVGPSVVVPGAVAAQRELEGRARVVLFGDQDAVRAALSDAGANADDYEIVHAPENISMSDSPAKAIRSKKNSSIVVACESMKRGEVNAFVSAGSTGAVAAAGLLIVGRLPKVNRPAIASVFPTKEGLGLFLDVGANSDCKPEHLLQFGAMGRIYAEIVLRVEEPRVGLMNIGEEPSKGSELVQDAHKLLAEYEPNFIGNIEGRDLFDAKADVIILDGFTGNVVLKILEGAAGFIASSFRDAIAGDLRAKLGALTLKPALREYAKRFDYAEYGGAPLLGLNEVIIICHGGSSPEAIKNAIKVAERGVRDDIPGRIRKEIAREEEERAEKAARDPLSEETPASGAES